MNNTNKKTPLLRCFIKVFQGYAARGGSVPFVPVLRYSILTAPRDADTASGMRTPFSLRDRESVPLGTPNKKTPLLRCFF